MLTVELVGDKALVARLDAIPDKLREALTRKVNTLALQLEAKVKGKLSNDVLQVRTGALRRSIFSRVDQSATGVTGTVGSSGDVKYAAIHEYGAEVKRRVTVAWGRAVKDPKEFTFHYPRAELPPLVMLAEMRGDITEGLTGRRDSRR